MTLDELSETFRENPPEIPDDLTREEAHALALELFEGCEATVTARYLSGMRDAQGIAIQRGDPIKVTDEDRKDFGQAAPVTRTWSEDVKLDDNTIDHICHVRAKGGFECGPLEVIRADEDPLRDVVAKLVAACRDE